MKKMKKKKKKEKYLNNFKIVKINMEEMRKLYYTNEQEKILDNRLLVAGLLPKEEFYEDGKEEATLSIAKNMLAKGTDVNFISEVTNLSIDEINKIKESSI